MKKVVCRDINGTETEPIPVEKLVFRPSVYGVIVQNGKVLLVPQWNGYDFPGGGIDLGETLEEALLREVKEETGLSVTKGRIITSDLMYFLCANPKGELSTDGFDEEEKGYAKKAEWVDIGKISKLKFYNPIDSVALINRAVKDM